jgi:hypothetical protein
VAAWINSRQIHALLERATSAADAMNGNQLAVTTLTVVIKED